MRILSLCLLAVMVFTTGCFKSDNGCSYTDNNVVAPAAEQAQLESYLSTNGITTAVKHPSGFYYEILSPGTGVNPGLCSVITVGYTGTLTNGNVFDQQQSLSFQLGTLIEGWRKGIPLIKKGGSIQLYLPPSLGYGAADVKDGQGNVVVPANSILLFEVNLMEVQ
ncbi:MAG TPA: FKBP-type peptidyl-prolyl cis-trans isomerase [Chitinophagaceae bacterium]|nr:FKBP-type peptidyl-prolyl cis-trans isomerase [Chitinophagaceae bacterium]